MDFLPGVVFLDANLLISLTKRIESHFPGWWWSVSQKMDCITLSMGPGRNCPFPCDNEFGKTSEGDKGFIHVLPLRDDRNLYPSLILNWVDEIYHNYKAVRKNGYVNFDRHAVYRKQIDDHLQDLVRQYEIFLRDVPRIYENDYYIQELYLGACDISVDCSIRGTCPTGEFDISIDLTGNDVGIGSSLSYALTELKGDILTHIWNRS